MTTLRVTESADAAAEVVAERVAELLRSTRQRRGRAHIGLAGGSTPRRAYQLLAQRLEDWSDIDVWFSDERAVGPDDPDSNYRMVAETLLAGGGPPPERVHRIEGERGADEAARGYEAELRDALPVGINGMPSLDISLQGLGPDGHTASLFPRSTALEAPVDRACVAVHDAPKPPRDRVTMTVSALAAAKRIIFLTTGEEKASAVWAILKGPNEAVPASLLGNSGTELIVDKASVPRAPRRSER